MSGTYDDVDATSEFEPEIPPIIDWSTEYEEWSDELEMKLNRAAALDEGEVKWL